MQPDDVTTHSATIAAFSSSSRAVAVLPKLSEAYVDGSTSIHQRKHKQTIRDLSTSKESYFILNNDHKLEFNK